MYKGNRFFVPKVLRAGLMKTLHSGHPGVVSMLLRAKQLFWWPGLKGDIADVKANFLQCHGNAPSHAKEPSKGVPSTNYVYESLSMDHFFLKGLEYLAIVDRYSGILSVHGTAFKGPNELLRILRLHCQRNGIPRAICTYGSSIFLSHETQDLLKSFHIKHRVSTVSNAHLNLHGELAVKHLKHILREYVGGTGNLNSDLITQGLLSHTNTPCKVFKLSPAQLDFGRCI